MSLSVEFSTVLYLKSGKVVASDPVELSWTETEAKVSSLTLQFTKSSGSVISTVRNGRYVVVPLESIDYVEFITDQVQTDASS